MVKSKTTVGVLTYLCTVLSVFVACASLANAFDGKLYTCITDVAAGLIWKDGKWKATGFTPEGKFLLTIFDNSEKFENLDMASAVVSGLGKEDTWVCSTAKKTMNKMDDPFGFSGISFSCVGGHGRTLIFSDKTMRGGISNLLGSIDIESKRDGLTVMPFICKKD